MKKLLIILCVQVCLLTFTSLRIQAQNTKWTDMKTEYENFLRQSVFQEAERPFDFESNKLKFRILSEEDRTVAVFATFYYAYGNTSQYQGAVGFLTDTTLIGTVEIPSHITYNGSVYTVTVIDNWAFTGNPFITSIIIPSTITTIGEMAFQDNYILFYTFLGTNLHEVEKDAFDTYKYQEDKDYKMNMDVIRHCYIYSKQPSQACTYMTNTLLHVPVGCKEAYQQAEGWKQYGENIVDDINLEGIHHAQLKTQDSDAPTYDLQGRRVENPKQGEIYIQNGKKYINK